MTLKLSFQPDIYDHISYNRLLIPCKYSTEIETMTHFTMKISECVVRISWCLVIYISMAWFVLT